MLTSEVRLGRIRITDRAIEEVVDRTALVSIPRADVTRVVLRRGRVAERPVLFLVVGVAAAILGVYGLIDLMDSALRSHVWFPRAIAMTAIAIVGGPLLIVAALRRGYLLDIETRRATRRLGFGGGVEAERLPELVTGAAALGVVIETALDA